MCASNFKNPPLRDPKWLKQVSEMPCILTGRVPPSDPAHVSYLRLSQSKAPDDCVLPLCHDLHAEQHNIGEKAFWRHQMNHDDHFMMECVKAFARQLYRDKKK